MTKAKYAVKDAEHSGHYAIPKHHDEYGKVFKAWVPFDTRFIAQYVPIANQTAEENAARKNIIDTARLSAAIEWQVGRWNWLSRWPNGTARDVSMRYQTIKEG